MNNKILSTFLFVLLISSCSHVKKRVCFSNYMNNHRFNYITDSSANNYFTIKDTIQMEFVNGYFYAKSKIVWIDCDNYFLVVREANYEKGLRVGDTLHVRVSSFRKDTITYTASAYGQTYQLRVVKADYNE